jgi:hypothetical protein
VSHRQPRAGALAPGRIASTVAAAGVALALACSGLALPALASPPNGRYALGDSVMRGAKTPLQARGFAVDAKTSRQVYDGVRILKAKRRDGTLRRQVVVHLGTNGTFSASECRAMHRIVGGARNLYVTTVHVPRSWESQNNRVVTRCARRYKNVFLIDWQKFVRRHGGLIESDGYHLTPRGARRYAVLVDRTVDRLASR